MRNVSEQQNAISQVMINLNTCGTSYTLVRSELPRCYFLMIINQQIGGFVQVGNEEGEHDVDSKAEIDYQIDRQECTGGHISES